MGHTHRYKLGFEKETGKESQYLVSHPELGLDPPIGSAWDTGCDTSSELSSSEGVSQARK